MFAKYLSMLLRHHPEAAHLTMSKDAWVEVDEIVRNVKARYVTEQFIRDIVKNDAKQRFDLKTENGKLYIRANQGHSIDFIDMQYEPVTPPDILYHGTAEKYINSIMKGGLLHRNRQFVHLSKTIETATAVGERHGKPVILEIDAKRMHEDGIEFYLSKNGVWLTKHVDIKYIKRI